MLYDVDIIVLKETSVFVRLHENYKPALFKKNPLGTVFENLRSCYSEMLFECTYGRKAKTEEKRRTGPKSKSVNIKGTQSAMGPR